VADGTDEASNLGYATVAQAQSQFAVAVPTGAGQADGLMSHEDKAALDGLTLAILSDITGVTGADRVTNIISLTQAEYDAITPDAATFYVIKE
jgi:hypothetical protein